MFDVRTLTHWRSCLKGREEDMMLALANRYAAPSDSDSLNRMRLKVTFYLRARSKNTGTHTHSPQNLRAALDTSVGKIVLRQEAAVER